MIGVNPFVEPPVRVLRAIFSQAGRERSPIPVRGRINGSEYIQTLVKYAGIWRLYINGPMMKSSGSKLGDKVHIEIAYDPRPRVLTMSDDLAAAFRRDKKAAIEFGKLAPSRQKEIIQYIGSLRSRAAIDRNIAKVISHLGGKPDDSMWRHVVKKKDAK